MISPAELAAWLRLAGTPGIGRIGARRLLAAFGSPQAVFEADPGAQRRIVGPDAADALSAPPEGWAAQVDTTVQWLAAAGPPRDILSGFLSEDEKESYGRPVGVTLGHDRRSLLMADDVGDVIWRVTAA